LKIIFVFMNSDSKSALDFSEIARYRLRNQQISDSGFKTVQELVAWMGAIQAQDVSMAKWAIGIRLPESTEKRIDSAIDIGEVIRTHLLRPTWHFVSCNDIYWMLELSANQIKASMKSRDKELELSEVVYKKSYSVLEKAFSTIKNLSREDLVKELSRAKIPTNENRAAHILMRAELDGLICSGSIKNSKQTYALLRERVPVMRRLKHEESLAQLAQNYFKSHGPATIQDFTWWSGLPASQARFALELIKAFFYHEKIGDNQYWFPDLKYDQMPDRSHVYLMPAYDEFIISYKDRTSSLIVEDHKKTVSTNGIFRPIIVIDGKVEGIWKRTIQKDKMVLETRFFRKPDKKIKSCVDEAILSYSKFLKNEKEIIHKYDHKD
jgi:hypothetical protein